MKNLHSCISHAWLIIFTIVFSGNASAQWSGDTLTIQGRDIDEIEVTAPRVQQATATHDVINQQAQRHG